MLAFLCFLSFGSLAGALLIAAWPLSRRRG